MKKVARRTPVWALKVVYLGFYSAFLVLTVPFAAAISSDADAWWAPQNSGCAEEGYLFVQ